MNSPSTKACKHCGAPFSKRDRDSMAQWDRREFCSIRCANAEKTTPTPIAERLMRHVSPVPIAGCWLWTGATDGRGYGHISTKFGEPPEKAYRASYRAFVGEIPAGMVVRHKCDTPLCINPSHLEIGTQKDNAGDMTRRGRMNPSSMLNLRPGMMGFHGAGPISNKERMNG